MYYLQILISILGIYISNTFTYYCINGTVYFIESLAHAKVELTRSIIHAETFPDITFFFAGFCFVFFLFAVFSVSWIITNYKKLFLYAFQNIHWEDSHDT